LPVRDRRFTAGMLTVILTLAIACFIAERRGFEAE
jgi:hypothetical protein